MGHRCSQKNQLTLVYIVLFKCRLREPQQTTLAAFLFKDIILATAHIALGAREGQHFLQKVPGYYCQQQSDPFLVHRKLDFWKRNEDAGLLEGRLLFIFFSFYIYTCIHAWCLQKRTLDLLKLKLWTVVSHDVVLGITPEYPGKAWFYCLSPLVLSFKNCH